MIGGRECTEVVLENEPTAPASTCQGVSRCLRRVSCKTPAGVGNANDVIILIGVNGVSEAASRGNWLVLRYRNPVVERAYTIDMQSSSDTESLQELGLGSTGEHSDGLSQLSGVPTLGGVVELRGSGFGTEAFAITSSTFPGAGLNLPTAGNRTSDSILRVHVPAGVGIGHIVDLQVGRSSVDVQAAEHFSIRYARPRLVSVSPALVDTRGGEIITIIGENLGADVLAGFEGLRQLSVTIGGRECAVMNDSARATLSHDEIRCLVPVHSGRDLPVVASVGGQRSD